MSSGLEIAGVPAGLSPRKGPCSLRGGGESILLPNFFIAKQEKDNVGRLYGRGYQQQAWLRRNLYNAIIPEAWFSSNQFSL